MKFLKLSLLNKHKKTVKLAKMQKKSEETTHIHTFPNSTVISRLCAVGLTAREAASE